MGARSNVLRRRKFDPMVQCRTSQLRTLTFARQGRVHLVAASFALSGSVFVAVQTSAFRALSSTTPGSPPTVRSLAF